ERLQGALEADRAGHEVVRGRRLSNHGAKEIVRQHVRQISFRTSAGVLQRKSSICIVDLIARRSSSLFHRARYSVARSSGGICRGSSKVVTTTIAVVRNPGWLTRNLVSRIVIDSGNAWYACRSSERIEVGFRQRTR